jgi:hypothetical protein
LGTLEQYVTERRPNNATINAISTSPALVEARTRLGGDLPAVLTLAQARAWVQAEREKYAPVIKGLKLEVEVGLSPVARGPRIGICGFFLEANRFSPPTTGEHFAQICDLAGEALGRELQAAQPHVLSDLPGFACGMGQGDWEPVPLRVAAA